MGFGGVRGVGERSGGIGFCSNRISGSFRPPAGRVLFVTARVRFVHNTIRSPSSMVGGVLVSCRVSCQVCVCVCSPRRRSSFVRFVQGRVDNGVTGWLSVRSIN